MGGKNIPIYQVDAFASELFAGNPAAVCPLSEWLPDSMLQNIAMENNLAETAFTIQNDDQVELRWFTPKAEVDLCGHATLATAYVYFNLLDFEGDEISFHSPRSGPLPVRREGDQIILNFPADEMQEVGISKEMKACFNRTPIRALRGKTDLMLVFESEADVRMLNPDFRLLNELDYRGVITTAPGDTVDFVSRFFAPQVGIDEDPVTGSAHTSLTPYWAKTLSKNLLKARQISPRGGSLLCTLIDHRVELAGQGKLYMTGEIFI